MGQPAGPLWTQSKEAGWMNMGNRPTSSQAMLSSTGPVALPLRRRLVVLTWRPDDENLRRIACITQSVSNSIPRSFSRDTFLQQIRVVFFFCRRLSIVLACICVTPKEENEGGMQPWLWFSRNFSCAHVEAPLIAQPRLPGLPNFRRQPLSNATTVLLCRFR